MNQIGLATALASTLLMLSLGSCDPPRFLNSAVYHEMRGSLQNSQIFLEEQKTGQVAFLGGSITYNPGWRMPEELMKFPLSGKLMYIENMVIIVSRDFATRWYNPL